MTSSPSPQPINNNAGVAQWVSVAAGLGFGILVCLLLSCLFLLRHRRHAVISEHRAKVERFQRRGSDRDNNLRANDGGGGMNTNDSLGQNVLQKATFMPTTEENNNNIDPAAAVASGSESSSTTTAPTALQQQQQQATKGGPVIIANPLAAITAAASTTSSNSEVQRARTAAAVTAAEVARAKSIRLGTAVTAEDTISHVPMKSLTRSQRALETLIPGTYTLGLGIFSSSVPSSHDLTHPNGPTIAGIGSANAPIVKMGSTQLKSGSSIRNTPAGSGDSGGSSHWLGKKNVQAWGEV